MSSVDEGGGGFLNCLHCSALALLLHSAIMWPIQEPRTEREREKKGALRNFSKSETLASERDPGGKKRECWEGGEVEVEGGRGRRGEALSVAPQKNLPRDSVSHRVLPSALQ